MEFSNTIQGFNTEFNLNAVKDYNNYLQKQASFDFDVEQTDFARALDNATKSIPLNDKTDPAGMGSFMEKIGNSLGGGLDAVNRNRF